MSSESLFAPLRSACNRLRDFFVEITCFFDFYTYLIYKFVGF